MNNTELTEFIRQARHTAQFTVDKSEVLTYLVYDLCDQLELLQKQLVEQDLQAIKQSMKLQITEQYYEAALNKIELLTLTNTKWT